MTECQRCGKCCIATRPEELIGGSAENNRWLRKSVGYSGRSAECRYLLPRDGNGHRLCAIYDNPVRPESCDEFPGCLTDDALKKLMEHSHICDCPLLMAEWERRNVIDDPEEKMARFRRRGKRVSPN